MSKKSFTLLVILIIVLILGLGWYFVFRGGPQPTGGLPNGGNSGLFPFGQGPANGSGGKTGTTTAQENGGTGTTTIDLSIKPFVPKLRQISTFPTAGVVAFDMGSTTVIRYVERSTGHIFETKNDSSASTEISNVTIPKIYEAIWSADGKNVILRYIDSDGSTIKTFDAAISTSTPLHPLEGSFLSDNIKNISVSGNKMFYLLEDINGAEGIRANTDGSSKTTIFSSSFGDWTSAWTTGNILLYSRPGATAEGGAYILNSSTGSLARAVDRVTGLSARLNADESMLLYSGTNGNLFKTSVIDLKKGTVSDLGVATLADKCVCSTKNKTIAYCAVPRFPSSGMYPDDWYKGKVSFTDSIWKIDTVNGTTEDISDPELDGGASMDIMKPSLDQNENALVFINKSDLTAWRLDLSQD